jgi:hypothetical protein
LWVQVAYVVMWWLVALLLGCLFICLTTAGLRQVSSKGLWWAITECLQRNILLLILGCGTGGSLSLALGVQILSDFKELESLWEVQRCQPKLL